MATATLGGVIAAARRLNELTEPDSDAELLRRFLGRDGARDEAAFALLVTRYGPLVLSACRRIVPDTHLADDAFQATFVVLATKAASLDGRRPLGPWLYAVACQVSVRARVMIGRRRKRETLTGTVPDTREQPPRGTGFPACADETAILDEEIGRLSAAYREAVVLCELQGLSRRDAAKQLGVAEGTISSRLAAARKALAARLKARGVAPTVAAITAISVPADLAAAAVAVSTGRIELSTQLTTLVKGGLAMAFVSKLKLGAAVLAVAVMLFGVGGVMGPGGTSGEALAAPVPKIAPDPGLIWLHHPPTGKLTAYTPDGKKHKELKLPDGRNFVGFTRDGTGILFIGKNGRVADPDATDGLSLHVRDITEKPEGTDLGLELQRGDQLILSPDGTQVVRKRLEAVGIGRKYTHTLIDRATKKETKIDLPKGSQVVNWSPDGKAWRLIQSDSEIRPNQPGFRWLMYPVAGGKPTPLCEGVSIMSLSPSPDCKTFLGTDCPDPLNKPATNTLLAVDGATGKKQELTRFEDVMFVATCWSPDGKKIAAMRYDWHPDRNAPYDARLVVLDADGRNSKELAVFPVDDQKTRMYGWFPTPPASADPPKKNAPVPEVKGKPKPNYFPHEKGTVWVYQNSLENPRAPKTLLVKEVTGVKADGQDTLVTISQWYTTDPPLPGGPGPVEESEYRVTAAGDVLSVRFGKLVMDPPSLFVRAALKEDDEWEFRRGDVATKYAFKVEKAAELTVPAGTYTAVPLRMLVDGKGTGNVTYFADGVGMVKSASYVLTEFKPGKAAADPRKKNAPVPKVGPAPEGVILVGRLSHKEPDRVLEAMDTAGKSLGYVDVGKLLNVRQARVSPDGKKLAFVRFIPLQGNDPNSRGKYYYPESVYVVDLPLKEPPAAPVISAALDPTIAWDADGKTLIVSRIADDVDVSQEAITGKTPKRTTVRLDAATKKETALKLPDGHAVEDVSPDGKTLLTRIKVWNGGFGPIAYSSFQVPLDTMKPKRLGDEDDGFERARFSPDSTRVAGVRVELTKSKETGLFVADVGTGKIAAVTLPKEMDPNKLNSVAWAPDGKRLAVLWRGPSVGLGVPRVGAGAPGGAALAQRVTVMDATGENAKTIREYAADDYQYQVEWADPKLNAEKSPIPVNPPKKNAPVPKEKDEGTITLLSRGGESAVAVVKPDGTAVSARAAEWDQPYLARPSPDDKRLLWMERAPHAGQVIGTPCLVRWIDVDAKPGMAKSIATDAYNRSVAWSPDGKGIYFSRIDAAKYTNPPKRGERLLFETWLYDVTTDRKARVELPGDQAVLDVSPDGQTLVTRSAAFETDDQRLFLVPLKTLKPVPVGEAVAVMYSPRFSPDGKRLLFSKIADTPAERSKLTVCVLDVATAKETPVAVPKEVEAGGAYHLCWSPDGKRIALHWHEGGAGKGDRSASRVTVCDADGSNAKLIVKRTSGEDIVGLDWR